MANMALNIEQRLGQKLTNEQQLLWSYMVQRWPNLTFSPFVFIGSAAAGELTIYDVNKLYLAYEIVFSASVGTASVDAGAVNFFNELNANSHNVGANGIAWDVTAAAFKYSKINAAEKNIYFSRFASVYNTVKFIGYKITI